MEIEKIYLDLDGVLADFNSAAQRATGEEVPDANLDAMWADIRQVPHFFNTLELMPGAKELFDALYARYGSQCEILTAVPKAERGLETAVEDKIAWAHRMLAEDIKVNVVLAVKDKRAFCQGPGMVLIDDWKSNIKAWEKAGGTGILCRSCEEVVQELKALGIL